MDQRTQRLREPHVAPLTALIEKLRHRGLDVPNVDPNDGGVKARVLFLLESPGPKAVTSGFVSRNNPDPSARNMSRELDQAGFTRGQTLLWNVVPQCVSTAGLNRNATRAQIIAAAPHTQAILDALPYLRVIVFCGRRAGAAAPHVKLPTGVQALFTYHPGAQAYNRPKYRSHFQEILRLARALLDE